MAVDETRSHDFVLPVVLFNSESMASQLQVDVALGVVILLSLI